MGEFAWLLPGLVWAAACAGSGLPEQPVLPEHSFVQRDFRLGSGLRILVQEDHSAPLVAVVSVYGVGSSLDPAGQEGLAHLLEHLTFRGGQGQSLDDRLRHTGASYNAFTEPDTTTYFAVAHSDQLASLLDIEGARLAQPIEGVTPEIEVVEREVVRNESSQRHANPALIATLFKKTFGASHPMAREIAPGQASLATLDLPAVERFAQQHYQPDNCTIVVAGDINPETVAQLLGHWPAELLFGPQGRQGPTRPHRLIARSPQHEPPGPRAPDLETLKAPVQERRLIVAWAAPPTQRAGDPFLATALAALQLTLALPWDIGEEAVLLPSRHGSMFAVEIGVGPGANLEAVRSGLLERIMNARRGAAMRSVLGLFKWIAGTEALRGSADLLSSTISLGQYLATTGKVTYYKDTFEQLAAVDKFEITDFLEKYLSRERAVALLVEPDGQSAHKDGPSASLLDSGEQGRHDLEPGGTVSLKGMGAAEILKTARSPGIAALPRYRLPNGLSVILVPRKRAPVAQAFVRLPSGDFDIQPFGLASLAADFSHGTCTDDDFLLQVGGQRSKRKLGPGRRHQVQVLSGNLSNGMAALANELRCREPVASGHDFMKREVALREKALTKTSKEPSWQAHDAFMKGLYPDQRFGLMYRDLASLKNVGESEMEAAVAAQYRPEGATAVIVSDRPEPEVRQLVERFLGPWAPGKAAPQLRSAPAAGPPSASRLVRVFAAGPSAQSYVRIGCRLPPAAAEMAAAYQVLEAMVQQEANQMRSNWGATYGLEAEVLVQAHGIAHLQIKGAVAQDRTGDVIARLIAFFNGMAKDGPEFKGFTLARWDLARGFNRRFATGSGMADAILDAADQGWPAEVWDRYPEQLAGLQRSVLRDLMVGCAGHEIITLTGDAAVIGPQLAKQGLGL